MKELFDEIKTLNRLILRLVNHFSPEIDKSILDRYIAFRALSYNHTLILKGVKEPDPIRIYELKGIEHLLEQLKDNTEQFLKGLPHNNVLLYGPRGVGKSSAVKCMLNEYQQEGLRLIEVDKDALMHLPEIKELIRGRTERYIVFCDDLSFDVDDSSYRQLKATLEGSIEAKPQNMVVYATSNRRHLMPERVEENLQELHPSETMEEKVSLSDRFGLRLGFTVFNQDTYLSIVKNYVKLRGLRIEEVALERTAIQWSISHGSFSGRTARQFVDHLEGRIRLHRGV
jgi:hypothetical protein